MRKQQKPVHIILQFPGRQQSGFLALETFLRVPTRTLDPYDAFRFPSIEAALLYAAKLKKNCYNNKKPLAVVTIPNNN